MHTTETKRESASSLTTLVATSTGPANDVHVLSSATRTWTALTGALEGSRPAPRSKMGFASAKAGRIYMFGGIGRPLHFADFLLVLI